MVRYWVIAPSRNSRSTTDERDWHPNGYDTVWGYDQENSVIAIGWGELGDLTGFSREAIKRQHAATYNNEGRGYLSLQRFWCDISPGDRIIARRGTRKVVGIGTVIGKPVYDPDQGDLRTGGLPIYPYPNFLPVKWGRLEEFNLQVSSLPRDTVAELKQSFPCWPEIVEAILSQVWPRE